LVKVRTMSDLGTPAGTDNPPAPSPKIQGGNAMFAKRLKLVLGVLVLCASVQLVKAQTPEHSTAVARVNYRPLEADRGASALWQSLQKLHTRASLIMVTAHPDDEDGGMLAYESRGQGASVALLTLNRGEAGQNVVSNNYWDQLGLVRTQELLAAGRYYGVQQYFTRVVDFGFSKTREEALQMWGADRVRCDVVRVVRMTRPLVMTSVFIGNLTDGHGQHQVAGQMSQEVYKQAGDPNVCPDQIKEGLLPWAPLKVYGRVPSFSISPKGMYDYATDKWAPVRFYDYVNAQWSDKVPNTNVEIPEGEFNTLIGDSYLQIAREGLGWQKTQNGGTGIPTDGPSNSPYHRYGSRVTASDRENSFFDGIDVSLGGIATLAPGDNASLKLGLAGINALVEDAIRNFSAGDPDKIAPTLAKGLKATRDLTKQVKESNLPAEAKYNVLHELHVKEAQFNDALAQSLGVAVATLLAPPRADDGHFGPSMTPESNTRVVTPASSFDVVAYTSNSGKQTVQVENVSLHATDSADWKISTTSATSQTLSNGQREQVTFRVAAPDNAALTKPYFHRDDVEQSYYDLELPQYLNMPFAPYPLNASVMLSYEDTPFAVQAVVQTAKHVTGFGSLYQPLIVAPAISVSTAQHATIIPLNQKESTLDVSIHNNIATGAKGSLHLNLPQGWTATPQSVDFNLSKAGEDQSISFTLHPDSLSEKAYPVTVVAELNGKEYTEGYVTTGYNGLHPYNEYNPARVLLSGVDAKMAPGLNVGYVMGTGDSVPKSLESLGVHVRLLSDADLSNGDLSKYNVIVLGVRAYAARPELATHNRRLLDFAHNGGVVVVQYQTDEYDQNYGPYPYTLSRNAEKVIDETAQVRILDPQNPLMSWPNRISDKDFGSWVEERGHSFMREWAPDYKALTEVHDAEQDPQKGGLLYASYGQGKYVYVAYALYRQLEEGVPGAYRLFANLLSLPLAPQAGAAGK
jgi:LmbE family N-acetylglucosaminyl deacetylase